MYKYLKELENLDNYKTYLVDVSSLNDKVVFDLKELPQEVLIDLKTSFTKIEFLDMLISGLNEKLLYKSVEYKTSSYDKVQEYGMFFNDVKEEYYFIKNLTNNINLSIRDLKNILSFYSRKSIELTSFFPQYVSLLTDTHAILKDILKKINNKSELIVDKNNSIDYKWPNCFYITPNGYLYNGGVSHSEGNLTRPFFYHIKNKLEKEKNIPNISYNKKVNDILKRGYITSDEFRNYSNLMYHLPTIKTPEVENNREIMKNILKLSVEEYEKMLNMPYEEYPHPERSYQKNLINLIIGHLDAKETLYKSFSKLNNSNNKKENINKICQLSNNYLPDILVRYVGFSKIESIIDRTITTSNIKGIDEFKNYLDNGWNLYIIPGIRYDYVIDKVDEVNMNSHFIEKYLEKELDNYNAKGKIYIKR